MSAAAHAVMEAFAGFMGALSQTDPTQWEPDEVIAFADGIEQVNTVMQMVKQTVVANADL